AMTPVPRKVLATELTKADAPDVKVEKPEIIGEVIEKREKNVKHFLNDDMSYTAVIYPSAVHYLEDEKLTDIDNSLSDGVDESNAPVLENRKNSYKVKIAKSSNTSKLVTIRKDQYEIAWSLDDGDKTKAVIVVPEGELPEDKTVLRNLQSTARYEEILPGIDLEYAVMAEEVKENIVVKSRMEVPELSFSLYLKNMVPALDESGSIMLRDMTTGEEVMEMPAPFMVDAIGEASYGVEVGLTEVKAGSEYRLTLKVDNAWLADESRQYPVVIDPVVSTTVERTKIFDAPVSSAYPNTNYVNMGLLKAGYGASSYVNRSYLQFTLPALTAADLIVDASLNLATYTCVVTPRQIEVYKVNSAWSSSTITWNNKPSYNSVKAEEYQMVSGSSGSRFDWDITGIVKEWYSTGVNNGLMLKNSIETSGYYIDFHSSDTSYGEAYRPQITISYVNNSGLEGYWSYHSQSVGRAGTGYVNDYNGNLVLVHEDISLTGSRLPLSLGHVWNSNEAGTDMGYGAGWRTSLSQTVVPRTIDGIQYYAYTDEDGTIHYFLYDSAKGKYVDESGIDMSMAINGGSTEERYVITDKGGNSLIFSSLGKLGKIRDLEGNQMTLAYGGNGALYTVTDGSGRVLTLNTDGTGRLLSISDPAGRSTSFTYNGTQLERITYPDGKYSTYAYDGNKKLVTATNHDGYRIGWSYYGVAPYRVQKISETSTSGALGGELTLSYGYNTTVFTDYLGRSNTYQFNNQGNTISIKDNGGYGAYYGYSTAGSTKNKLTIESKLQKTVVNELRNHGGESGSYWFLEQFNGATGSFSYATDQKQLGNQSIKVIKIGMGGSLFSSQSMTLEKGKTYTLSAYMKTSGVTSVYGDRGALAAVRYQDAAGWKYAYGKYHTGTNDWTRVEVSFTIPSNAISGSAYACLGMEEESGTAWFDSIQLEEGSIANRYNLVQNGDFKYGLDGWSSGGFTTGDGAAVTSDSNHPSSLDDNVLKINGNAGTNKSLVQNINVSGSSGDVFVMGGWTKGASVPLSGLRYFALDLAIRKTDGTTQWAAVNFNEDSGDWQYMSSPIIADGSYSSISIYALYYLNLNTTYFDGIQLYREEYGQSYQYDSNGNVTSTVDLAKQNTSFDYNTQNDLVKSTDPKGSFFTYEYSADGKRRLTKATSAENVVYSFEYDSYGNPRKAKVSGATSFMESSSTYTASGAYADTITESSGNSVSYAYNESKGTLTSVTDPKGKTATYSYDSNTDALTGVSKTVDGSVVTNGYTYENDRLKTIAHNGFSYTFGYDALGNSTTVSAGSQTLITNSFDLRTGRLLESTYGNGHKVATDYDNLDRVATYKVWNSATGQYEVKFRYGYDASGNLGYLEDVVNSASYRYVYDLADRLVKISGSDGSSLTNGFDVNNNVSSITETFGSVNNPDMAYNHASNSSSVENPSFIASYAFDANNSSRWSSYATDNEWIYVDLGSSKSIGRVVLDWEYAYGKSYDIQVSNDATSWTTVFSTETGNGGIDDISGLSATGRYVRMNGRLRGTVYGYSLWSFEVYSGDSVTVNYEYDNDNRPKKVTLGSGAYGLTNYGELGRIDTSVISTGSATWTVNYAYHSGVNGSTTARVASITNNGSAVSYTYDQNGNIESITDGTKFTKYYYNELSEVIREDNGYLNKSITYSYDAGGNILNKKEYAYTTGVLGSVLSTIAYTYGDTNWKDKLTAYNGKSITYDAIGNPLSYDGWTYTWENGRQLK
ncbi:MAG: DNRLRE domain-containing protein, partial [Youngiibacter sp.]|nr:DNRLRE domain-containing protein [Youngiibacter sp.]